MFHISIKQIIEDNKLELVGGEKGLDRQCVQEMITRPGLEFLGYFDYFDSDRIMLVGSKEATFLSKQKPQVIEENLRRIFDSMPPCIVFSKNVNNLFTPPQSTEESKV